MSAARNLLRLDAAVCLVGGAGVVADAAVVADHLGVDQTGIVRGFGAFLAVYGVALVAMSRQPHDGVRRWTRLTSFADAGWVLGVAGLVAAGALSSGGNAIATASALAVGGLGAAKTIVLSGRQPATA